MKIGSGNQTSMAPHQKTDFDTMYRDIKIVDVLKITIKYTYEAKDEIS